MSHSILRKFLDQIRGSHDIFDNVLRKQSFETFKCSCAALNFQVYEGLRSYMVWSYKTKSMEQYIEPN